MKRLLSSRVTSLILPSALIGYLFGLSAQASTLFEDFETPSLTSKTSYAGEVRTLASGDWWICAVGSMTAGSDHYNGAVGLRLRGDVGDTGVSQHMVEMRFDKPDGAGTVSYKCASYASHSGGIVYVEYSTDQGASWALVSGSSNTVPSWASAGEQMLPASVAVEIAGPVRIRIVKAAQSGSNSVNIDDIEITDFGDIPPTVTVTPPFVTVEAGNTVTANVTAKDSEDTVLAVTAWSLDIANTDYTFENGVFTWLADATGTYTVLFAAEDAAGLAKTNTLTITVNLPAPSAPTVETTAGSILLSWDPVPGATGYSVQAYKLATEVDVFTEGFSGCTDMRSPQGTTVGVAGGNTIANDFSSFGLDGWTGFSVYSAYASNVVNNVTNYMVKFGTGNTNGWIQTPPMDLSANDGECTLTFRLAKWASDTVSVSVLHITDGGATTNTLETITTLPNQPKAMTLYTVPVTGGTEDSMICFASQSGGNRRFFLDDVRLFYVAAARIEVPNEQIAIDGTTARVFGLPTYAEYLCTVTATDGDAEEVSPEVPARTTAPTVIILR
ncbi:MAG: hypothetical protein FWG50_07240 [Kiritimatiellaeota bacterium]|nr:hypothetical protein [Kiritimatiellota bacterium]